MMSFFEQVYRYPICPYKSYIFYNKHMKIGLRLSFVLAFLTLYDFEPRIILSVCLTFQSVRDNVQHQCD